MRTIDVHAHLVPPAFLEAIGDGERWGIDVPGRFAPGLLDVEERIAAMDATGVDVQILSSWAGLVGYGVRAGRAADYARRFNEALAEAAATAPERLRALAIAPLQAPAEAAAELEHAVTGLGMLGVEILTRVNERELDDEALDPFWERAQGLGCLVLIHPSDSLAGRGLGRYRLDNLIGNPAETTIAVGHLVCGGVLERFPGLRICAVHAGGYLPYAAGRLDRGYRAQPEIVATRLDRAPSEWLRELYYDTVGHSGAVLRFLADFAGPQRMLMGSDYPFAMGEPEPVRAVSAIAGLGEGERAAILGGNAERLLKL